MLRKEIKKLKEDAELEKKKHIVLEERAIVAEEKARIAMKEGHKAEDTAGDMTSVVVSQESKVRRP